MMPKPPSVAQQEERGREQQQRRRFRNGVHGDAIKECAINIIRSRIDDSNIRKGLVFKFRGESY
jgi:hypothetical protein